MCTDGQPQTQPMWAKITRTVHGKGQRAESKDQHADICHVCADGHTLTSCVSRRAPTDLLCVLNRHPTWAKITRTVHGKDQRADMCTDGQPRTSCVVLTDTHRRPVCADGHTQTATDVLCVLTDSHGRPVHGRPVCADGHRRTHTDSHGQPRTSCVCWRTPTDILHPTWAKITRTVHGKDQRADMCTDGQPRTSCCVLTDSHGRPVCRWGGCFVEPSHEIESSKWAIFGMQNWRCRMNRKPGYGAQLRANLEPTKGVGRLRQQDGGHGTSKMDGAEAHDLYPAVGARARPR
ncbi:unnamed protein product [Brassica rapa]|uniref:Uncharacterized protein n=1 Tax=Brassica campestris TaxID=3711 RepID=A0A8D9GD21_BRACM|nr:unnamed protein product [Brassica rapa]